MLFTITNSFFYKQKVAYFVFKDSSSPVKACNFNPLNPDLLTLYRRPNPIKIWPTHDVPLPTMLYHLSTYDLWRAVLSPTIFQPVEKLIPLTTTSQSGPDQPPLYFRPTRPAGERGRAGFDRFSGVNGTVPMLVANVQVEMRNMARIKYPTRWNFKLYTCWDEENG